MSRYRFVEAESSRYPVAQLCRIAQVSRTAYYDWQQQPGSARAHVDAALTAKIRADPRGVGRTVRRAARPGGAPGAGRGRGQEARGAVDAGRRVARAPPAPLGAHDDAGADAAGDP
jgi:putative transposase